MDVEKAYQTVRENAHLLQSDTLLHGDYCLPNILLSDWRFTGFIDLGNGGVGDRHVDLFWGAWTLRFNLKTDAYRQRFFDAYGNDLIDRERLVLIGIAECFG
jgi:kanamycin kinase